MRLTSDFSFVAALYLASDDVVFCHGGNAQLVLAQQLGTKALHAKF
jgi:hypothetical protein